MNLVGTSWVVIGASGVLGGALAEGLVASGADVALLSRSGRLSPSLVSLPQAVADVRDEAALDRALQDLGGEFDGIINATGVVAFGMLGSVPEDVTEELMATNATAVVHLLGQARRRVRAGGVVVNLSGVAAEMSIAGMAAYCASKTAAHTAMVIAQREFRAAKIRVLDARPPHTETGLASRALFGEAPRLPEGCQPRDVAQRIIEALANDEADLPSSAFATSA
jgi:cyclic-di-GMP-binding biofilm dispersal mediator protein